MQSENVQCEAEQQPLSRHLHPAAQEEAAEALASLGYQKAEAVAAVRSVAALADTAEELILLALKRLDVR